MTEGATVITSTLLVGIVMGIVQVLKVSGLPSRYAGLVSLILGLAVGVAEYVTKLQTDLVTAVVVGLGVGLAAAGAYSGSKAIAGGYEPDPAPSAPPS